MRSYNSEPYLGGNVKNGGKIPGKAFASAFAQFSGWCEERTVSEEGKV